MPPGAVASTGKFCRLLAPVSASPTSLAVTPLLARSMPRSVFPSSEFLRIALPVAGATTAMPLAPFPQMTLPSAPSVAEPIVLFEEPEIRMP